MTRRTTARYNELDANDRLLNPLFLHIFHLVFVFWDLLISVFSFFLFDISAIFSVFWFELTVIALLCEFINNTDVDECWVSVEANEVKFLCGLQFSSKKFSRGNNQSRDHIWTQLRNKSFEQRSSRSLQVRLFDSYGLKLKESMMESFFYAQWFFLIII